MFVLPIREHYASPTHYDAHFRLTEISVPKDMLVRYTGLEAHVVVDTDQVSERQRIKSKDCIM